MDELEKARQAAHNTLVEVKYYEYHLRWKCGADRAIALQQLLIHRAKSTAAIVRLGRIENGLLSD